MRPDTITHILLVIIIGVLGQMAWTLWQPRADILSVRAGRCRTGDTAHFRTVLRVEDALIGRYLDEVLIGCTPPGYGPP